MGFDVFAQDGGGVFAEFAIFGAEGRRKMAVDVEFANDFPFDEHGDDDFGFSFERAREVARVCVDVVDDNGLSAGSGGSADSLVQRDPGVGSHRAAIGSENEYVWIAVEFEHVKADPVVAGKFFMKESDDGLHETVGGGGLGAQSVECCNDFGAFSVCGCHL